MRLTPTLLLLSLTLTTACSRNPTITQAFATCHASGQDTSVVTFEAWFIARQGWPLHAFEVPPEPSNYARYTVHADFGRKTPLKGVPVRVEDDHDVLPTRTQTLLQHVTLTGAYVCNNRGARVDVLSGYFVPTSVALDNKTGDD